MEGSGSGPGVLRRTWVLLWWNASVSFLVSAEFINLLVLSYMIWPGEAFHALEMGGLITARLWMDGVAALFWGWLADRFDRRKLHMINSAATGSLVLANAFLPVGTGFSSYYAWLALRMTIGAVMSGGGPLGNSLSSDLARSGEKSQYFGYSSIVWQVVQIGSMVLSAFMFSTGELWRLFFVASAGMFFCMAAFLGLHFKEPARAATHESFARVIGDAEGVKYDYRLTWETVKDTILRPTNILVFSEGIFTNVLFGIIDLIWLPYIQSSPRNISATVTSLFILVYGVPGAILGSFVFAKASDKHGARRLRNRVLIIAASLLGSMVLIIAAFSLPLPALTKAQGADPSKMFAYPVFILFGALLLVMRATFSIFGVNQPPILQEINLPEAQGRIASLGQLVEIFSYGSGPLLAGAVLVAFSQDYQASIQVVSLVAMPGICMWFLAVIWVEKDQARIKRIVEARARDLKGKAGK
ncbi:MAG: MFS transporter [Candidatus Lokiarchaeota archaeon]|nr:MFS transporter [Candidatus Lokiarchaeota archaeon]